MIYMLNDATNCKFNSKRDAKCLRWLVMINSLPGARTAGAPWRLRQMHSPFKIPF